MNSKEARIKELEGLLPDLRQFACDAGYYGLAARIDAVLSQQAEPASAQDEREAYTDWYKETYKTSPLGFDGSSDYRAFHAGAEWQRTRPAQDERDFWVWLDQAYRDGSKGESPKFTKYNMQVAFFAGAEEMSSNKAAVLEGRENRETTPAPEKRETVEVVGYTYAYESGAYSQYPGEDWLPLMTVTQHERIVGALTRPAQKVDYINTSEQQPVATWMGTDWDAQKQLFAQLAHLEPGTDLYAVPVAQPEQSNEA